MLCMWTHFYLWQEISILINIAVEAARSQGMYLSSYLSQKCVLIFSASADSILCQCFDNNQRRNENQVY